MVISTTPYSPNRRGYGFTDSVPGVCTYGFVLRNMVMRIRLSIKIMGILLSGFLNKDESLKGMVQVCDQHDYILCGCSGTTTESHSPPRIRDR